MSPIQGRGAALRRTAAAWVAAWLAPPWHLFQPDGTFTCTVMLPDGFRPQDRGEDDLLGV